MEQQKLVRLIICRSIPAFFGMSFGEFFFRFFPKLMGRFREVFHLSAYIHEPKGHRFVFS